MNFSILFKYKKEIYNLLENFLETNGIQKAFLPTISTKVTNEPYTEAFEVTSPFDEKMYLQPSPEFYLKKLISIEKKSFFYIGPVYRANETLQTNIHLKEFDMLEWYKLNYGIDEFINLTIKMLKYIFEKTSLTAYYKDKKLSFEFEHVTWQELFDNINISITDIRKSITKKNQQEIREYLSIEDSFEDAFYKIYYKELYEQFVCDGRIWIIENFPEEMSALAKKSGTFSKRFEIYWAGIEIVNGYEEETDKIKLTSLFEKFDFIRKQNNQRIMDIDFNFIELTSKLPKISGASLGLDRLLFLLLNKKLNIKTIEDLQFFK